MLHQESENEIHATKGYKCCPYDYSWVYTAKENKVTASYVFPK